MSMPILLSELSGNEGFILSETIYNEDGTPLLTQGKKLDSSKIQTLKNYYSKRKNSIQDVLIPVSMVLEEKRNNDISGTINQELQANTLHALKKTYMSTEENLTDNLAIVGKCVEEISRYIEAEPNISYSLGQYKTSEPIPNVFDHSLRVAQFSMALANLYNNQVQSDEVKISLKDIGMVALLHDFGIRYQNPEEMKKLSSQQLSNAFFTSYPNIDSQILQKPYQEKYKNIYAYAALEKSLDNSTRMMLLLSNNAENKNVSKAYKTDSTIIGAKIIYLCNLYDSLLFNTIKEDISLENVSSLIGQFVQNGVVNAELGSLLIEKVPLYSKGVRVLLSTGQQATVIDSFTGYDAARPIVKTAATPSQVPTIIDLRNTTNITISKIIGAHENISDRVNQMESEQIKAIDMSLNTIEQFETPTEQEEYVAKKR